MFHYRMSMALAALALVLTVVFAAPASSQGRSPGLAQPQRSATTAGTVTHIAAAGDIACPAAYTVRLKHCRHAATARLIQRHQVDSVLALGDTQYRQGALTDYQASYDPTWGAFLPTTLPVIGNHEYGTPGADGYFSYFGARAHGPNGWYVVNRGSWRIYALNTNCDEVDCTAEAAWLRADLDAHPHRCSLAAMHQARFSSVLAAPDPSVGGFWPILDRHQVDVALEGHIHSYERFAPMHNGGVVAPGGIRSFVVGTGGKEVVPFTDVDTGSQAQVDNRLGVLFLNLADGSYSWRFRTAGGVTRDQGSADCVR